MESNSWFHRNKLDGVACPEAPTWIFGGMLKTSDNSLWRGNERVNGHTTSFWRTYSFWHNKRFGAQSTQFCCSCKCNMEMLLQKFFDQWTQCNFMYREVATCLQNWANKLQKCNFATVVVSDAFRTVVFTCMLKLVCLCVLSYNIERLEKHWRAPLGKLLIHHFTGQCKEHCCFST